MLFLNIKLKQLEQLDNLLEQTTIQEPQHLYSCINCGLCTYSNLWHPKYGNCSIDTSNQSSNLIKNSDLKIIYDNKSSESALE